MAEYQWIPEMLDEHDNHDSVDMCVDGILLMSLGRGLCGHNEIAKRQLILSKEEGNFAKIMDVTRHIVLLILATTIFVVSKNEQPMMPLRLWIVAYSLSSIFHCICLIKNYNIGPWWEQHIGIGRNLESIECTTYMLWWYIGMVLICKELEKEDQGSFLDDSAPIYLLRFTIVFWAFEIAFFICLLVLMFVFLLTMSIYFVVVYTCLVVLAFCIEVFKAIIYVITFNHIWLTYDLIRPVDPGESSNFVCTPELFLDIYVQSSEFPNYEENHIEGPNNQSTDGNGNGNGR